VCIHQLAYSLTSQLTVAIVPPATANTQTPLSEGTKSKGLVILYHFIPPQLNFTPL